MLKRQSRDPRVPLWDIRTSELDKILADELPLKSAFTITRRRKGGWYVRLRVPPDFDARVPLADSPLLGLVAALQKWQEHNGRG